MARKPCVLVTGGPTRAYLDRVRFLSNVSTGTLAFELCRELIRRGFPVALVSGPSACDFASLPLQRWEPVETNDEMHQAVLRICRQQKPFAGIFSAAVLDFIPAKRAEGKRSSSASWTVKLVPSKKILDDVEAKFPKLKRVAFKLEWQRKKAAENALLQKYLRGKKLEGFCVNYLSAMQGATHPATLFRADGTSISCEGKKEIARAIAKLIEASWKASLPKVPR